MYFYYLNVVNYLLTMISNSTTTPPPGCNGQVVSTAIYDTLQAFLANIGVVPVGTTGNQFFQYFSGYRTAFGHFLCMYDTVVANPAYVACGNRPICAVMTVPNSVLSDIELLFVSYPSCICGFC
jgi:hypothetical protein